MKVHGELQNIKSHIVEALESVYDYAVPIGQLSTNDLNEKLVEVTELLDREVAVYINRQGKIVQVSVGDSATVDLPERCRAQVRADLLAAGLVDREVDMAAAAALANADDLVAVEFIARIEQGRARQVG